MILGVVLIVTGVGLMVFGWVLSGRERPLDDDQQMILDAWAVQGEQSDPWQV